jgi:hypothetical protein
MVPFDALRVMKLHELGDILSLQQIHTDIVFNRDSGADAQVRKLDHIHPLEGKYLPLVPAKIDAHAITPIQS